MARISLEHVPGEWLDKVAHAEAYVPVLYNELRESKVYGWKAIKFIEGWLKYQGQIASDDNREQNYSKVFKGTITDVRVLERKTKNGDKVGSKVEIVFDAPNVKGKVTEQSITTGFLEYEFNPANYIFEMAQANTLMEVAQANIGNEVWFRKVLVSEDNLDMGDKVRYVGNIIAPGGGESSSNKQKKSSAVNSEASQTDGDDVLDVLVDMVDSGDVEFTDEQYAQVEKALGALGETGSAADALDVLAELEDFQFARNVEEYADDIERTAENIVFEAYEQANWS